MSDWTKFWLGTALGSTLAIMIVAATSIEPMRWFVLGVAVVTHVGYWWCWQGDMRRD